MIAETITASVVPANPNHPHLEARILVDQVASFVRRFVFLKEASLYQLIALWIIHTYLIECFDFTPYLCVHSPDKGCGKTCLLCTLDVLVFNSSGINASPTEAVLFRTAHGHTQILDEADTYLPRLETARGILNAGFSRQGRVQRMEKDANGKQKVEDFSVFTARVIAGIGSQILPPATRDRAFSIEMVRQMKSEKRERFRERVVRKEVASLLQEIKSWATIHKDAVESRYHQPFPYLEQFGDRTIDISEPIAAILEVAYLGSPRLEDARLKLIHALSVVRSERTEASLDLRILGALFSESRNEVPLVGNASELAEICRKRDVQCAEPEVSRALRQFGFETKSVRANDEVRKRYVLARGSLGEIVSRFLGGVDDGPCEIAGVTTKATTHQTLRNEEVEGCVVSVVGSRDKEGPTGLVGNGTAHSRC